MPADAGYLALIDRLATVRPPVFVFGGYAEDALLAGQTTRPHGGRRRAGREGRPRRAPPAVRRVGIPVLRGPLRGRAGSPLVYHAASDGIELELGIYDELVPGRPSFVLPVDERADPGHAPQRLLDLSAGPHRRRPDPTLSPLALYQLRAAIMRTGVSRSPHGPRTKSRRPSSGQASWRTFKRTSSSPTLALVPATFWPHLR